MLRQLYKRIRLLTHKGKEPYLSIYKVIGFYPDNIHLYEQAFLHKSSSVEGDNGRWLNNERLEFLGDAILDAVIADIVYSYFPNKREGFLTNTRSKIVQRETLNRVAVELGIDKMVVCSARQNSHNSHMAGNALEALVGAIYLDQGYECCNRFVRDVIMANHIDIQALARKEVNFKSSLIEWSQKHKLEISFDLIESFNDNDGNPVFQTAVTLAGMQIGIGIGYSKKESQQSAAKMAVKKLRTDKEFQDLISSLKQKYADESVGESTDNMTEAKGFEDLPDESAPAVEE